MQPTTNDQRPTTKYFLIAGETSGDIHAAALVEQIKAREPEARFRALGGDKMQAAGCLLYQHISHMAFMGFAAVLRNMTQVRRNFRIAKEALHKEQPDVLILIDYPSFNLKIAAFCRKHLPKTKIIYYIPPKVWAWKKWRVHRIAQLCDEVLGIFPFEPPFYARYGYHCTYVGNPTVEEIRPNAQGPRTKDQGPTTNAQRPTLLLLPGSRESEITHCLPRMIEAARRFPDYRIEIVAAPSIDDTLYQPYLREGEHVIRDIDASISQAQVAVVNSGTATLEMALWGVPQVAVYHLACSRLIGMLRWAQPLIFDIPYFTLVNIIAGKEVIKECLANDFTVDKVSAEVARLMQPEVRKAQLAAYNDIRTTLGSQHAASHAADIIIKTLKQ